MNDDTPDTKEYFVYMLRCADGTLYTGIATDVARRVREHNGEGAGTGKFGAKYTRARRPVVLVYSETCATRSSALMREHVIKQLSREEKMKLMS